MKLYVNEKILSIRNKFYVKNEKNLDVYEITSKLISIGNKTTITDMNGKKVAYIEEELLHITPNYKVYINDKLAFKIKKKLQFFKNDYIISNRYTVKGNTLLLNFKIYDEKNKKIASIKRKIFSIGDKYEIDIIDEEKKVEILAIIVAITNDVNDTEKSSSTRI